VRVGLTDEIDAATVLTLVDLLDRAEVHRALRIALKLPPEAWEVFDRLFDEHWGGEPRSKSTRSHHRALRDQGGPAQWKWDGEKVSLEVKEANSGDTPSYSPAPMLRRKPFEQLSRGELVEMERLIARLAPRLATRRSRRLVPTRGRGVVDLRRSLRHAVGTKAELFHLARRSRPVEEPKLVLLFDTSGSMDSHTRFFLAFAFALRRVVKRLHVFAFNTSLVRVTRMIAPAQIAKTLQRLAAGVPDWSGGTRIGACLAEFVGQYDQTLIDRHTVVVIVSDGLDHGDAALLQESMRKLRSRAGKIIWLNPLLGDPRYRPETDGMRAALAFVDHFGPAHNLEALEQLMLLVN
jgi:uncharacterized protein with von Willebrand factor type A (vWA) domain